MSLWTDDPKPRDYTPPPPPPRQPDPPAAGPAAGSRATRRAGPPRSVAVSFPPSSCPPRCSAPASPATTTSRPRPRPRRRRRSRSRPAMARPTSSRAVYAAASPRSPRCARRSGSGTGFLVDSNGTIVTNAHVVGTSSKVQVRFDDKGDYHDAQVLSVDASTDLAAHQGRRERRPGHPPAPARRLRRRPGRRHRDRDRLPARPRPHGDGRHRLRPRAPDPVAQRLLDRQGHPDRRAGQPRQLGRPAAQRQGPGDRRQLADRDRRRRRRGQRRHRVRDPGQHRQEGAARPRERHRAQARLPRPADARQRQNGTGAQIAETTSGGPAEKRRPAGGRRRQEGRRPDDRRRPDDVAQSISDKKPGDKVEVTVRRNGSRAERRVTLGQRPERFRARPISGGSSRPLTCS